MPRKGGWKPYGARVPAAGRQHTTLHLSWWPRDQKAQRGSGLLRLPRAAGKKVGSCLGGKPFTHSLSFSPPPGPTLPRQTSASLCEGENCPSLSQTSTSRSSPQKPPSSRGAAVANPASRGFPFPRGRSALARAAAGTRGDPASARCSLGIFIGLQRPLFQHGQN